MNVNRPLTSVTLQGWSNSWSLGCVNLCPGFFFELGQVPTPTPSFRGSLVQGMSLPSKSQIFILPFLVTVGSARAHCLSSHRFVCPSVHHNHQGQLGSCQEVHKAASMVDIFVSIHEEEVDILKPRIDQNDRQII